jgi:hypothetical protein
MIKIYNCHETYGITKRPIVSGTRPVDLTAASEMGMVAADEAQANAKTCAGTICFKYSIGLDLVKAANRPI